MEQRFDVVIVGGGNAAFSAALAAREHVEHVLVLEKAPREWGGGNSYFTAGAFRMSFEGLDELSPMLDGLTDEAVTEIELPLDLSPFYGFAVTCGITFTFGGLRIDPEGHVLDRAGHPISGLYAAGELVGGLFYHNYPGGTGLMSGAVFGRRAGTSAASYARTLAG